MVSGVWNRGSSGEREGEVVRGKGTGVSLVWSGGVCRTGGGILGENGWRDQFGVVICAGLAWWFSGMVQQVSLRRRMPAAAQTMALTRTSSPMRRRAGSGMALR
jgi:hypothetical protein